MRRILLALVVAVVLIAVMKPRSHVQRCIARSSLRASITAMPFEFNWQNIDETSAQAWSSHFGRPIAIGAYASPVFDQHVSNWCGCCYLIAVLQHLQDRMHVTLGIADPLAVMFPCFQFNVQLAIDTYNRYEQLNNSNWNACVGGLPIRVLKAIRNDTCVLRLMSDATLWLGHPCTMDNAYDDSERNISLEPLEVLENSVDTIKKRIFKYGPVVLGLNSRCLRDSKLGERGGLIDPNIVATRDHAVSVVGWKQVQHKMCWIVRNSWGDQTVPSERPDPSCVGSDYNKCEVQTLSWTGDLLNLGYAYVPFDYSGLRRQPSPWFDAIPTKLREYLPIGPDERVDLLDEPSFSRATFVRH